MEFDCVIVGAGSAGCVVASRLSEAPDITICLIEVGGPDDRVFIRAPLGFAAGTIVKKNSVQYDTVPQPGLNGRKGFQPRGLVQGGRSAINAMIYCRGQCSDYDGWAARGNPGWDYDSVLPWFHKSEDNICFGDNDFHGAGGPLGVSWLPSPFASIQAFLRACATQGIEPTPDYNGVHQEGCWPAQVTQRDGERCSTASAFITPHLQRPNLTVLTHSQCLRLRWQGRRAMGVDIVREGHPETVQVRHETILSWGSYGSPQLLMCSGVGPAESLQELGVAVVHDLPGLGQNLQDHITASLNWRSQRRDAGFGLCLAGSIDLLRGIREWQTRRTGCLTGNVAEAGAFLHTEPGLRASDIELEFVAAIVDDHSRKRHWGHGFGVHVMLTRPRSRGTVTLVGADTRDVPIIDPRYFSDPDDLPRLARGVQRALAVMNDAALEPWRGAMLNPLAADDLAGIERTLPDCSDTEYHPVGTCRMGPASDASAVVGADLKVLGTEGLRIADASNMPRITTGNTHARTVMIGEKCADLLCSQAC